MLWGSRTGGVAGEHALLVEAHEVALLERSLPVGPGVPLAKVAGGALERDAPRAEQHAPALRHTNPRQLGPFDARGAALHHNPR